MQDYEKRRSRTERPFRCGANRLGLLPHAGALVVGHLSSGSERTSRCPSASRNPGLSRSRKAFVTWHLGNSYSLAMRAKEAFHTETPNPSIERTRSGSAGLAFISLWAKPAPPPRAAHVKR